MDRGVKIAAASAVLLGGITVALLFRRESPQPNSTLPVQSGRLVPRKYIQAQVPDSPGPTLGNAHSEKAAGATSAPQADGPPAAHVAPIDPGGPPPPLPEEYPASETADPIHWGTPERSPPPSLPAATETEKRHKVVDGDTLEALAERYLGSAERAMEIYQINRDVMANPTLLPIGVELRVDPPAIPDQPRSAIVPRGRLVPILPRTR